MVDTTKLPAPSINEPYQVHVLVEPSQSHFAQGKRRLVIVIENVEAYMGLGDMPYDLATPSVDRLAARLNEEARRKKQIVLDFSDGRAPMERA